MRDEEIQTKRSFLSLVLSFDCAPRVESETQNKYSQQTILQPPSASSPSSNHILTPHKRSLLRFLIRIQYLHRIPDPDPPLNARLGRGEHAVADLSGRERLHETVFHDAVGEEFVADTGGGVDGGEL